MCLSTVTLPISWRYPAARISPTSLTLMPRASAIPAAYRPTRREWPCISFDFTSMVAANAANASSQNECTEAISFRFSAVRSSSDIMSWWLNGQSDKRRQVSKLLQCFRGVFRAAFALAQHQSPYQLAPNPQGCNGAKPDAGDISRRAQEDIAALTYDSLW